MVGMTTLILLANFYRQSTDLGKVAVLPTDYKLAEIVDPIRVHPNVPDVKISYGSDFVDEVTKRLWVQRNAGLGSVIHALRTFEQEAAPPSPSHPTLSTLRSILLDSQSSLDWYGGRPILLETQNGLRFVTNLHDNPAGQSHVGQSVALLAELGLPADLPLKTPGRHACIRDILRDEISSFMASSELEWSTLAISSYLPPQRTWKNRFGQEFSFDQVVKWLIVQPFDQASCGGTHALYTLAYILRVDRECPILSGNVRELLGEYLSQIASTVASSQNGDGSIDVYWYSSVVCGDWYGGLLKKLGPIEGRNLPENIDVDAKLEWQDTITVGTKDRILVTGHQLEWLMLLPRDMQPAPHFFQRGGDYLIRGLERAKDQELVSEYCPYSHAARVARLLVRAGSASRL